MPFMIFLSSYDSSATQGNQPCQIASHFYWHLGLQLEGHKKYLEWDFWLDQIAFNTCQIITPTATYYEVALSVAFQSKNSMQMRWGCFCTRGCIRWNQRWNNDGMERKYTSAYTTLFTTSIVSSAALTEMSFWAQSAVLSSVTYDLMLASIELILNTPLALLYSTRISSEVLGQFKWRHSFTMQMIPNSLMASCELALLLFLFANDILKNLGTSFNSIFDNDGNGTRKSM